MSELRSRMEFASEVARAAGKVVLRHYQTDLAVERKADQSPVTAADRASEQLLRERISARFPEDGILGEEYGDCPGRSRWTWILDPIDGTKSFIQGVPLFGVLIGLESPDGVEVGVVYLPALDELVSAARGEGCWWDGKRASVSRVDSLGDACLSYTSEKTFRERGPHAVEAWGRLCAGSRLQRGWGDCYGHVLVATGRADAMFDPVLSTWDCAAILPIVEEAGGTFTDWEGRRTIRGGSGISTNGHLFRPIFSLVQGEKAGAPSVVRPSGSETRLSAR